MNLANLDNPVHLMRLNNFTVPGTEQKVTAALRIETESLGGNTSATDRAQNGIKPKSLNVSLVLPFDQGQELSELVQRVESMDADGKLTVYHIVDTTAQALNIRQVQFNETLSVRELDGKKAWQVSFTLTEYRSVPEKVEQRQQTAAAETQSAGGAAVPTTPPAPTADGDASLTGFERFLAWTDDALAPENPADNSDATA